jgi:O-antigen/teichoic acid export membrane protein
LAHLPLSVLYGAARPDLPAKIHLGEAVVYLPLAFILVRAFGIPGAALSWTLRCTADLVLYEWATRRAIGRCGIDLAETARVRRLTLLATGLAATFALIAWANPSSVIAGLTLVAIGLGAYGVLAWARVLSAEERGAWMSMVPRSRQSA